MANERLVIDDRASGTLESALGPSWYLVSDAVMGGISSATLMPASVEQRDCLRLLIAVRYCQRVRAVIADAVCSRNDSSLGILCSSCRSCFKQLP